MASINFDDCKEVSIDTVFVSLTALLVSYDVVKLMAKQFAEIKIDAKMNIILFLSIFILYNFSLKFL